MSDGHHFRSSPRPQLSVKVEVHKSSGKEVTVAYTGDLGTGGLSLVGDHGLVKDDSVQVSLSTPSSWEPLRLNARVCWTKPDGQGGAEAVGLMFVDLSPEETVALNSFVASLDYEN